MLESTHFPITIWCERVDSNHRVGYLIYSQAHSAALLRSHFVCSGYVSGVDSHHRNVLELPTKFTTRGDKFLCLAPGARSDFIQRVLIITTSPFHIAVSYI